MNDLSTEQSMDQPIASDQPIPLTARLSVFVINLDQDHERLSRFTSHMATFDIPFARWRATPGAELDAARFGQEPLAPGILIHDFQEWSKNEAACGISHIRLLQHITRNNIPWAIIMEDDGVLEQAFPLDIVAWDLPEDAEIVLLNARAEIGKPRQRGRVFSYGDVSGGAGTEGYLISLAGAKKLLTILYPLKDPLDFQMYAHFASIRSLDSPPYHWLLPRNRDAVDVELKAYRIWPSLVWHAGDDSSIGNQRHPRARYYCKILLGLDFGADSSAYYYSGSSLDAHYKLHTATIRSQIVGTLLWKGVDISHVDETQQFYTSLNSPPRNLMAILRESGVNTVRLSLWVGEHTKFNTERALRLTRHAARYGLRPYIVFHYSDTWADPGHQHKPREWNLLPFDLLCERLYAYTRGVVEALCAQGTPPAIVQIGNEITNGMLWADNGQPAHTGGQLWRPAEEGEALPYDQQWQAFAALVRKGILAVRDAMVGHQQTPLIMLHIDKGADVSTAAWWLQKAQEHAIVYDAIGLSFYPIWHEHALTQRLEELAMLATSVPDKQIILAETAYPYRPFIDQPQTRLESEFLLTENGQHQYLTRITEIMNHLPNATGLYWWGATFINDAIEACPDCFRAHALFDSSGVALPALRAFSGG